MKLYRFDHTIQAHYDHAKEHMSIPMSEDLRGIVSVSGDKIAGMVLLHNWSHTSVQCHMVVSAPMCLRPPGLFNAVADYVFVQQDLHQIIAFVPSNHRASLNLCKRIGFVEIFRIPDAKMFGMDTVIQTLTYEQINPLFLPCDKQEAA